MHPVLCPSRAGPCAPLRTKVSTFALGNAGDYLSYENLLLSEQFANLVDAPEVFPHAAQVYHLAGWPGIEFVSNGADGVYPFLAYENEGGDSRVWAATASQEDRLIMLEHVVTEKLQEPTEGKHHDRFLPAEKKHGD